MAVFDTNFLIHLLDPEANPLAVPRAGEAVSDLKSKIEHLVSELEGKGETVIIPTPVLSEYLIKAENAGEQRLEVMQDKRSLKVVGFGKRAAIVLAELNRASINRSGDKKGGIDAAWKK